MEDRDGFSNDPRDDQKAEGNADPGAHRYPASFVHPICASKDADVE